MASADDKKQCLSNDDICLLLGRKHEKTRNTLAFSQSLTMSSKAVSIMGLET